MIRGRLSRTLESKESAMSIEIRDAALEARIQKQLQATGGTRLTSRFGAASISSTAARAFPKTASMIT